MKYRISAGQLIGSCQTHNKLVELIEVVWKRLQQIPCDVELFQSMWQLFGAELAQPILCQSET